MATFEDEAGKSGLLGMEEARFSPALPPPADIFVIPNHATTHASTSGFADQIEDGSNGTDGEAQTLQGRPKPSTGLELIENPERLINPLHLNDLSSSHLPPGAAAPIHPPPADVSFDIPLSYPATGPWRTANTILSKDITNHQSSEVPPAILVTPTQDISTPPLMNNANDVPPPKYRRNHWTKPSSPPGGASRNVERGIANPEEPPETSAQGGRFPRWRGWLEKRAMERHYAQTESQALPGSSPTLEREGDVRRKKSWGAGVEDDDALSEVEETEQGTPLPIDSPLHIHNFGSRFISHIPSLPLCAVSIELPPAAVWSTARLLRRSVPEASKRRVLLIGTIDGLYAVEFRRQRREEEGGNDSFSRKFRGADPRSRQFEKGSWNGDIRVVQVWTGVGVYQLSILNTQQQQQQQSQQQESDARSYLSNFTTRPMSIQESGIMLALCSTKIDFSKNHAPFAVPAASQSGLLGEVNFSVGTGSSSTVQGGHHREANPKVLSTGYVGTGGGGGQGKICPPSGSGDVRMWSIEAIRRIVTYALDSTNHQPLDLLRKTKVSKGGISKTNLAARIRKVWAHLGDSSSDRKMNRLSRQYSSDQSPISPVEGVQMRPTNSADGGKKMSTARIVHNRSQSEQLLSPKSRMYSSPTAERESPTLPEDSTVFDSAHQDCIRLAHSWVPIVLPGSHHPYASGGASAHAESNSSLYSDENLGTGPSNSNLGHSTPSSAHVPNVVGKGISFYALIEAGPEVQGTGTWYLALAQAKTILLYESVKPTGKGDARSWAFIKEFYTPVSPKSMTFCFSESPDTDELTRNSISSTATTSSNRRQLTAQKSVKSSSYSSVFRSHPILNLFVSLGKKAVLIRASDGNVKELELLPKRKTLENEMMTVPTSDTGHQSASKSSLGHSHSRRGSDMHDHPQHVKEYWVGIDRVTAQVTIRCKHHNTSVQDVGDQTEQANNRNGFDDEDDDEEDEEDVWDSDGPTTPGEKGVTLHDTSTGLAGKAALLRKQQQQRQHREPQLPIYNIFASLAILTKSTFTHILPSPLPKDVFQPRPLEVIQWSAVPTSVTASARVIGLERDLSSGAVSIDTLGRGKQRRMSMMSSYSTTGNTKNGESSLSSNSSNTVILHILVSLLACLPSRIEMKRVRVKLPIRTPFVFRRDSELQLEPINPLPLTVSSMTPRTEKEGGDDGQTNGDEIEAHQELEYLCGMLLPTSYNDQQTLKPWAAAGDGGAWTFDWRGANDFRLFYAGVQI